MIYIILFSLIVGFAYTFLIRHIYRGWMNISGWVIPRSYHATQKVSVIVAARNEEKNIEACIKSILNQSYPSDLVEIIIVDDFSEDKTALKVQNFENSQVRLIKMSDQISGQSGPAYKKMALTQGIHESTGSIIVTTDADCIVPKHWVASLISYIEAKNLYYVTAPIRIQPSQSWLEKFQSIEMLGMNAVTAYGLDSDRLLLSNGANLAFKKEVFSTLQGFDQIDDIASGDDVLFLQKVYDAHPDRIGYCKSHMAFVDTLPVSTFSELLHQRIRWASKYNRFNSRWIKVIMAGVFLYSLLMPIFLLLGLLINTYYFFGSLILIFFKGRIDYWYLNNLSQEFSQRQLIKSFIPSFLFYPIQIILVGSISLFKKNYIWKGRSVK